VLESARSSGGSRRSPLDVHGERMRDQYAGDVSDVLKFAFLRALASTDRTLGIAWYYAPGDDGRPDGRHLEWRDEVAWRLLDEELHAGLATLPERSIAALEQAAIWPKGALFHREPIGGHVRWNRSRISRLDCRKGQGTLGSASLTGALRCRRVLPGARQAGALGFPARLLKLPGRGSR
jgi:hypothetical protein